MGRVACAALLASAMLLPLAGCKDSDEITEVIYDQEAEEIDYDNPTKVLVQDPEAEETTDELPLVEGPDTNSDSDTDDDPEENDEEDNEEQPDKDNEDQSDEAATDEVPTTEKVTTETVSTTNSSTGASIVTGDVGTGEESGDGAGSTEGDAEAGTNEGESDDTASEDGEETESDSANLGGLNNARANGGSTYYSNTGRFESVPTGIDYVAAVGEAATIVSMLAGDADALLYTDAEWASRTHSTTGISLQTVLGDKYNDDVTIAWSQDGDSYDLSDAMVQAMIADSRLECVFVISGQSTLTDSQVTALQEAGIIVSYLPDMTSASDITEAVTWVGKVFAAGDNKNTAAQELAETYLDFHDDILSTAASLASTSTTDDNGKSVESTSGDQMYTLYISDWVDEISYVGNSKVSGGLDTSHGIGICELGYRSSPLSYYLSVGGAINTASQSVDVSGTSLVWQFNTNHITALESDFSLRGLVSSYQTSSGNTGYNKTYLMSGDEDGVGTSNFPAVIVANQHIAEQMTGDKSSEANSLYKIYEVQQVTKASGGTITYVGPSVADSDYAPLFAVAGLTSKQNTLQNYSDVMANRDAVDYSILVNPEGLFESWTEGTVESVLETAWISCLYYGGENPSQAIYDFYSTFYGYSLSTSQIQAILDGPAE